MGRTRVFIDFENAHWKNTRLNLSLLFTIAVVKFTSNCYFTLNSDFQLIKYYFHVYKKYFKQASKIIIIIIKFLTYQSDGTRYLSLSPKQMLLFNSFYYCIAS